MTARADRQWRGHSLAVAVIVLLGMAIYWATLSVNYNWNWGQVPRYLVSFRGDLVVAPFDGVVDSIDDGRLKLTSFDDRRAVTLDGVAQPFVQAGDPVFEGDAIARSTSAAQPGEGALRRLLRGLSHITAGPLLLGLGLTLKISLFSLIGSLLLGLAVGLGRVSRFAAARDLSSIYVEIIRGTPLLVQIFIVYFFIGTVLRLPAFWAGVVALSAFTAAYVAEIIRAGIQAVPKGQTEAAQSLGLSNIQIMRHVVLPQATRRSLPPLAGQFINLIKDSSLVSVMALTDLTKAGREIVGSTFAAFEVWFTVAMMYLLLTGGLSWLVQRLEIRLARHD